MTTRGFRETQVVQTANLIADVLDAPQDASIIATVRSKVATLTREFPVYR
jgi:glycine hydroxymethyltransferase